MSLGPLVSHLVIGLTPKEKELKNEPRMFATMPMRVRLVQVVRENLSKGVKQLFPDITMTNDYKKLEMRKHNMGKDQSVKEEQCASLLTSRSGATPCGEKVWNPSVSVWMS